MSSPRLLVLAVMALGSAAFPASGLASLSQGTETKPTPVGYGLDAGGAPLWTADGQLSPGETVNVNFPLNDNQDPSAYDNSATSFVYPEGPNGQLLDISPKSANPFVTTPGGEVEAQTPFSIVVLPGLQCGARVPLRLAVSGPTMPAGSQNFAYGLATGGIGAYHRTPSFDVGNVIYDGQSKESKVDVVQDGLVKGVRIHIDALDHQFSTYWTKLTLVSPSGKEVVLSNQRGTTQSMDSSPTKTFRNVTFSDTPVNGVAPTDPGDAAAGNFNNMVIRPETPLAALEGELAGGQWKLRFSDISAPLESRRLRGRALSGLEMLEVGKWQIDTAGAVCSTPAASAVGPDAWFGDTPLIIDPDGGSIDASASVDPSFGGAVQSYQWDLDGDMATGSSGFETSLNTPTATLAGPLTQGKRTIRLKVTDNSGKVSAVVSRDAFITKPPVIDSITPNPTQIMAGTPVELTAVASDPDLPQNAALTYSWDLNDDGVFAEGTGAVVSKTWPTSGPQIVRVKVTDNVGAYVIKNQIIKVANQAPTATFKVNSSPVIVGEEITFDASASTDVDGTIARYEWDFNGDGQSDSPEVAPGDTPSALAKWTFAQRGEQPVTLRVFDNTGGDADFAITVDVTGRPVPAGTATPDSPLKGETVTFNAAGSHDVDAGGSIAKYEWDLDGNNSFEVSGATAVTAQKSYPNAGTIVAKLRVTDNVGATAMQLMPIVVRNPVVVVPPITGGGGSGGGGGTPTPTTPVPPKNPDKGLDGEPTPPGVINLPPGVDPKDQDPFDLDAPEPGAGGTTKSGFAAKISAGSKAKGKKIYKKGMAVAFTANDASDVVLKVMITVKDAKTMGLKIKKPIAIGSGKLVLKKSGTGKFVVTFTKKYQRYVKKAKKTPVSFRAVVTSKTDGSQLALAKKVVLVK